MDSLGRTRKFDNSLQRGLDNSFAHVFSGKVVPNELKECLKQEIENFLMQDANDQYLAPNNFRIGISAADYKNLSVSEPNLPNQLADHMMHYCCNNGWGFTGSISAHLQAVESLHTGQLRTASTFAKDTVSTSESVPFDDSAENADSASIDAAPPQSDDEPQAAEISATSHPQPEAEQFPTASRPIPAVDPETATELSSTAVGEDPPQEKTVTLLLRDDSSRIFEVRHGSNIIGCGTASDSRPPDTGVSRQHAEITWGDQDAVLVDLYSTNGIIVNGEPIDNWLLADGDEISLGHSILEVQIRQVVRSTRLKCHYPRFADTFLE